MSFFLFVDESGQDHRNSPHEVLAGVAVEDRDLWNLSCALLEAEHRCFGGNYRAENHELKAKKLLNSKTFRHAAQMPSFAPEERARLAREGLNAGAGINRAQLTALAQSKIAYVSDALDICFRYRCRAFASIVDPKAPQPAPGHLRKDYAYLFERFFYFLEDQRERHSGIVVFDELEKSQSHLLLDQMTTYFRDTKTGQRRAGHIIPEPFFVHSDLTIGIQLADLVAYIVSWGVHLKGMTAPGPVRPELGELAQQVLDLRYVAYRTIGANPAYPVFSFAYLNDLRPKDEK